MHTFSVGAMIHFGWETFKKRPFFLIGIFFVLSVLTGIASEMQSSNPESFVLLLLRYIVQTLVYMGMYAIALKAHDDISSVVWKDIWHPKSFWSYFFASLITGIIIALGFVALVIPGIIAMIFLVFVPYFVIDQGANPFKAIAESFTVVKMHWKGVTLFLIAIVALNLVGLLALIVGLLVTVPVSMIATAHAYRTLCKEAHIKV